MSDKNEKRQAVIVIHGVGEQRPMSTLRGFVDAVLGKSKGSGETSPKYYNRPDLLADNLELRRLVSAYGRANRTDFYEFYWAHLMPTATWGRLASWYYMLMRRRPRDVPEQLKVLWVISWLIAIAVTGAGLLQSIRFLLGYDISSFPSGSIPWLIIAIGAFVSTVVRGYAGDAAVYLSPTPQNIEARQKIRASALALLGEVVASNKYDRVIVVGHSLGSVIGYDLLTFAWQRHISCLRSRISDLWRDGLYPIRTDKEVRQAEQLAEKLEAGEFATWHAMTRKVDAEQRVNGDGWLVTDFITLGSPLCYGSLLLSKSREDFNLRSRERELPISPPALERGKKLSFDHRGRDHDDHPQNESVLHDAAVFAVVAWTNIYFQCKYVLKGDVIGGPIAPVFGPGVHDIEVKTHTWRGWLTHTFYWKPNENDKGVFDPVERLQEALNLDGLNGFKEMQTPSSGAIVKGVVHSTELTQEPPLMAQSQANRQA